MQLITAGLITEQPKVRLSLYQSLDGIIAKTPHADYVSEQFLSQQGLDYLMRDLSDPRHKEL